MSDTADTVKRPIELGNVLSHLAGLGPWRAAAKAADPAYTDVSMQRRIVQVLREFERTSQYRVNAVQVINHDDGRFTGTIGSLVSVDGLPVYRDSALPYYESDAEEFFAFTLKERPVQQLQRVRVMLQDQVIFEVPTQWLALDARSGKAWILPVSGPLLLSAATVAFAQLRVAFGAKDYLPVGINVDYIAGLPDGWNDEANPIWQEWSDLGMNIEKCCARAILSDVAHVFDPGIAGKSVNADGATQSLSYTRFEDRKKELDEAVAAFMETFKAQETPFLFGYV